MIYLQTYQMFESMQDGLTLDQKELLDDYCKPYKYDGEVIDPEKLWWVDERGLVNVKGDFIVNPTTHKYKGRTEGLLGIKFGRVEGNFKAQEIGLEKASDLPREVGGNLSANGNKFRTLEGIGKIRYTINLRENLLVSLEGMTEDLMGNYNPDSKFDSLFENPVRAGFLIGDLEYVLVGDQTWEETYLDIVLDKSYLSQSKDPEGTIIWVLENKLGPEVLEKMIKKSPEMMSVKLAKVSPRYRKYLNSTLDKINLPPGFREDRDLMTDLGDVGL